MGLSPARVILCSVVVGRISGRAVSVRPANLTDLLHDVNNLPLKARHLIGGQAGGAEACGDCLPPALQVPPPQAVKAVPRDGHGVARRASEKEGGEDGLRGAGLGSHESLRGTRVGRVESRLQARAEDSDSRAPGQGLGDILPRQPLTGFHVDQGAVQEQAHDLVGFLRCLPRRLVVRIFIA